MTYEFAKKLKDAGYKQWECGCGNGANNSGICSFWRNFIFSGRFITKSGILSDEEEKITVPTLSELIDFVDGSDKLKDIEYDYVQKALLKLQKEKDKQ